MPKQYDLTGKTFGRLTVQKFIGSRDGHRRWLCHCTCGSEITLPTVRLTRTTYPARSCGCVHKENAAKLNRLPKYQSSKNRLFYGYKNRAARSGRSFTLSRKLFERLTQQDCHYCGLPPSISTKTINPHGNGQFLYNGLDRKKPKGGYTKANVVPCCWHCNMAKHRFSYKDFLAYLQRIAEHYR